MRGRGGGGDGGGGGGGGVKDKNEVTGNARESSIYRHICIT